NTSPEVASSRPPSSCSRVVLPEPDVPMIAMRSPLCTLSSTPRSTSTLRPTSSNVLTSARASSTTGASFIAQSLRRRLPCRGERGIKRGRYGQAEREQADLGDLEHAQLRGQLAQEVHLRG